MTSDNDNVVAFKAKTKVRKCTTSDKQYQLGALTEFKGRLSMFIDAVEQEITNIKNGDSDQYYCSDYLAAWFRDIDDYLMEVGYAHPRKWDFDDGGAA